MKAQTAANHKGIVLLRDLIKEYSLEIVQAYMHHIQANAEHAVRGMLRKVFFPATVVTFPLNIYIYIYMYMYIPEYTCRRNYFGKYNLYTSMYVYPILKKKKDFRN